MGIGLFMLAVLPGLVSTAVYRLIMPARAVEWGDAVVQGLFYSTVNLVLGAPWLYLILPVKDQYAYMELFVVPPSEGNEHAQGQEA